MNYYSPRYSLCFDIIQHSAVASKTRAAKKMILVTEADAAPGSTAWAMSINTESMRYPCTAQRLYASGLVGSRGDNPHKSLAAGGIHRLTYGFRNQFLTILPRLAHSDLKARRVPTAERGDDAPQAKAKGKERLR